MTRSKTHMHNSQGVTMTCRLKGVILILCTTPVLLAFLIIKYGVIPIFLRSAPVASDLTCAIPTRSHVPSPPPNMPRSHISEPFYYGHVPKNVLLILLSLFAAPLSITSVLLSLVYSKIFPRANPIPPHDGDAGRKTILVTGISMTKGLTIARILSEHTPHRIVGADTSPISPGRFSTAIRKFYTLALPQGNDAEQYIDALLEVIRRENVDLWISCSSVVAAVEDGEVVRLAKEITEKRFRAIQFRKDVVERLHDKDQFIDCIRSLGLTVPESHRCTSQQQALDILLPYNTQSLSKRKGKKKEEKRYIMKPIGVDDRARANMMTLLPLSNVSKTKSYIQSLTISSTNPFQIQQYISGIEYCTHALVVRGRVVAFTACSSSELLMHYDALPPSSPLFSKMLAFTQCVAEDGGKDFTGHLSFDFLAEGDGQNAVLYPIECNPRAHTAVVLFSSTPQMAGAYLSVFLEEAELEGKDIVVPCTPTPAYFWIGHDAVVFVILPILDLLWGQVNIGDVVKGFAAFWDHAISWRDGTFSIWDPVPFLILYHIYWPTQFLSSLRRGRKWSRINVSTTKVFEA